jgi:GNAT superfamily N-acetyltransferase
MIRIESTDLLEAVDTASEVLRESWPPPYFAFTPDYLRWRWSAPPARVPIGVVALDGDEAAGLAAAVSRRVRFRGESRDVALVSYVAVRPPWRGLGVAGRLYATLLAAVRESGLPVVTFAQPGTDGQKVLERAYRAAGFRLHSLGAYRGYGLVVRPEAAPRLSARTELAGEADFAVLASDAPDDTTLLAHQIPDQWEYNQADPRPRAAILARGPLGEVAGGVTVVRADMITTRGPDTVALIDRIVLAEPNEAVLQALVQAAARRWSDVSMTSVPNICGLAPSLLRAAGLRQTPSCFDGYLASADPSDSLFHASRTNLEVV